MAIGNDNLWTGAYSTVKAFLVANLTDPRGRYKDNWVHPGMPNINNKAFNGFPFVTLTINFSDASPALDLVTTNKEALIIMEIVSDNAVEVDTWSDQIYSKIKTAGKLEEIKSKELDSSPIDYLTDENNKKVYTRTIGIREKFRK